MESRAWRVTGALRDIMVNEGETVVLCCLRFKTLGILFSPERNGQALEAVVVVEDRALQVERGESPEASALQI